MGKRNKKMIMTIFKRITFPIHIFFLYDILKCYKATVLKQCGTHT